MTKLSWTFVGRAASGFGSSFWTPVHCPVFLNSSDGTSHLWRLFSLELEEGEDVEKINWTVKGWGQTEKAGGMFMGLCAKAESGVGLQKGIVPKGGQQGKCWNAQYSMILFPKWCFAVPLHGLTNPHFRVSIIGESWDNNITVSISALPSEKYNFLLVLNLSLKGKPNRFSTSKATDNSKSWEGRKWPWRRIWENPYQLQKTARETIG